MAVRPARDVLSRLLLVTAVAAERDAVTAGLGAGTPGSVGPYSTVRVSTGAGEVLALAGGIGPAAAAAATATALALGPVYDAVLSVGVGGGFAGSGPPVGGVAVASEIVAGDLGVLTPEGTSGLAALGVAGAEADEVLVPVVAVDVIVLRVRAAGLPVAAGPLLTMSTMTGTSARAAELAKRFDPVAEAMEGAGVAVAAGRFGRPVLELRGISNVVGARDRTSWEVPAALDALRRACAAVLAEPLPLPESPSP